MKSQFVKWMALALMPLAMMGCERKQGPNNESGNLLSSSSYGQTFTILAGSELKDVESLVQAFGMQKNVQVQFKYTGSLDAVDELAAKSYDSAWLSHGKYLQLVPEMKSQIKASEKTMYSRVVLGVKPEKMSELGWANGKTNWKDILKAVEQGKFKFAMTNPTGSNSGFVSLVGLAASLSGKGDALEESDIPEKELSVFFKGQSMTAGSSGFLADKFVAESAKADALINYESVIKSIQDKVKLTVLIPKEGVVTADYPLMRLTGDTEKTAFYNELVAYLRSPEVQKDIAQRTGRTPLLGDDSTDIINELPFPGNLKVIEAVLQGFLDVYSKPAVSYFVVDTSGSMDNYGRLVELQKSLLTLSEGDGTVGGRFASFKNRESIGLVSFSNQVSAPQTFELTNDKVANTAELGKFANSVRSLYAGGGTAIYSAISSVYGDAQAKLAKGDKTVSIVLLTDGSNNSGMSHREFLRMVNQMGEPKVPVYTILYGEGNSSELSEVAQVTGGNVFDARKAGLKKVMKSIRAYQ